MKILSTFNSDSNNIWFGLIRLLFNKFFTQGWIIKLNNYYFVFHDNEYFSKFDYFLYLFKKIPVVANWISKANSISSNNFYMIFAL